MVVESEGEVVALRTGEIPKQSPHLLIRKLNSSPYSRPNSGPRQHSSILAGDCFSSRSTIQSLGTQVKGLPFSRFDTHSNRRKRAKSSLVLVGVPFSEQSYFQASLSFYRLRRPSFPFTKVSAKHCELNRPPGEPEVGGEPQDYDLDVDGQGERK